MVFEGVESAMTLKGGLYVMLPHDHEHRHHYAQNRLLSFVLNIRKCGTTGKLSIQENTGLFHFMWRGLIDPHRAVQVPYPSWAP